jgi:S-methyl-5-thioribose-1-phosphate isomerase
MLLRCGGEVIDAPSVRREGLSIVIIDQRSIPRDVVFKRVDALDDMAECIRTLAVRGAPAIGAFAGIGLAICISEGLDPKCAYDILASTRPTAVDLRNCLDRVLRSYELGGPEEALKEADRIVCSIVESCRMIGEAGAILFGDGARILTHCNAGALATVDWGTALSPIRVLSRQGKGPFVHVSETRPLLQGSRLTAWELSMEGIRHHIVADAACAHLMREGMVDSVIVGADRVCRNGDIANKIGTYEKAILAERFGIPFYVAFPFSTNDPQCPDGGSIHIEMREGLEFGQYLLPGTMPASECWNPAFDWTPSDLISGFITEKGILDPSRIGDTLR